MSVTSAGDAGGLVYKLGNLTLLPSEINAMVGAQSFAVKSRTYVDQPVLLTKSISGDLRQGTRTGRREFADAYDVHPFDKWTPENIQVRHNLMIRLVHERWPLLPEQS